MQHNKIRVLNIFIEAVFYLVLMLPMIFYGGVLLWTKAFIHYLVTFLLLLYLLKSFYAGRIIFFNKHLNIPILLFLASLILSTVFSIYLNHSIRSIVLFFDAIAVFILSISEERDRRYFNRLVFILIGVGILQVIYAIYNPLFLPISDKGGWYIRGTFFNHNHFVAYIELIFFLPIFLLYLKRDLSVAKRYFLWVAVILFSIAIILSLSRGGIVSIMLSFVILSVLTFKGKKRALLIFSLFFCPFLYGLESTSS